MRNIPCTLQEAPYGEKLLIDVMVCDTWSMSLKSSVLIFNTVEKIGQTVNIINK